MDWLKRWNQYAPTQVAVQDSEGGTFYSYEKLYRLSCRLANHLRQAFGIRSIDRILSDCSPTC